MKVRPSIKQLQYLCTLARLKHFRKSAEENFVVQSSLSASIKELEEILGIKLFERNNKYVLPLEHTRIIVEKSEEILKAVDELTEIAHTYSGVLAGDLTIDVIPTISPFLPSVFWKKCRKKYPDVSLIINERQTEDVIRRINEGKVSIGIIALPYPIKDMESFLLKEDELFFASLNKGKSKINSNEIDLSNLIVMEDGHCLKDHSFSACNIPSKEKIRYKTSTISLLIDMVLAGVGNAVLPKIAIDQEKKRIKELNISKIEKNPKREIVAIWRKNSFRKDFYKNFAQLLKDSFN